MKPEKLLNSESTGLSMTEEDLQDQSLSYLQMERRAEKQDEAASTALDSRSDVSADHQGSEVSQERVVDVVLSDMCEPWLQTDGFWKKSLTNPYNRMMNTSGMNFRDHAGSMVSVFPPILKTTDKTTAGSMQRGIALRL